MKLFDRKNLKNSCFFREFFDKLISNLFKTINENFFFSFTKIKKSLFCFLNKLKFFKLIVFEGKTGDKLFEMKGNGAQQQAHNGSIYSMCWDPTSKMILTVSGDKSAKIWNVAEQTMLREFKFGNQVEDQQIGCLWQGNHLLSVALTGNISYLNFNDSTTDRPILRTIKGHNKSVTALEVAQQASGETLIFSGNLKVLSEENFTTNSISKTNLYIKTKRFL